MTQMKAADAATPPVNKKGRLSNGLHTIWKYKFLYLMLLPGLLYFIVFRFVPLAGYVLAFKDVTPFMSLQKMLESGWVGLKHFKEFFHSYYFWNVFNNTVILALCRLVIEFTLPIMLALMLNEIHSKIYKTIVQTVSYMPYFVSNVVLAGIAVTLLTTNGGLIPTIMEMMGEKGKYLLTDESSFRGVLLTAIGWKNVGWSSIVYVAAMSGVDPQLYEAASIDGASRLQKIIHVTLPQISFSIVIMFIMRIGVIMNEGWEETLLMYSAPVYSVSDILDTYVYRSAMESMRYSYSTAVSLFKCIIGFVLVTGSNWVAKRMGQNNMYT